MIVRWMSLLRKAFIAKKGYLLKWEQTGLHMQR